MRYRYGLKNETLKLNVDLRNFLNSWTDSLCISFTGSKTPVDETRESELKSTFDNCLIKESRDEFYSIWKKWFVTEKSVEDEKKPGKLKGKESNIQIKNKIEF